MILAAPIVFLSHQDHGIRTRSLARSFCQHMPFLHHQPAAQKCVQKIKAFFQASFDSLVQLTMDPAWYLAEHLRCIEPRLDGGQELQSARMGTSPASLPIMKRQKKVGRNPSKKPRSWALFFFLLFTLLSRLLCSSCSRIQYICGVLRAFPTTGYLCCI
jgi:hypothetical protein